MSYFYNDLMPLSLIIFDAFSPIVIYVVYFGSVGPPKLKKVMNVNIVASGPWALIMITFSQ